MTNATGEATKDLVMVTFIKDNIETAKSLVKACTLGKMVTNMMVTGLMDRNMATDIGLIKLEIHTLVSGS
jgi:hypothetical protein